MNMYLSSNTITAQGINVEEYPELSPDYANFPIRPSTPKSSSSKLWSNIGIWVIAVTAATSSAVYVDSRRELRKSGASSLVWEYRRRKGTSISLSQARQLALKILSETEERLKQDRNTEAHFLLSFWEDED